MDLHPTKIDNFIGFDPAPNNFSMVNQRYTWTVYLTEILRPRSLLEVIDLRLNQLRGFLQHLRFIVPGMIVIGPSRVDLREIMGNPGKS